MRKPLFLFLMFLIVLLLFSCAAQFPFIASVARNEMLDLQSLCNKQKLSLSEKMTADSLADAGTALFKEGKEMEKSYRLFERASCYYQIALSKNVITKTEIAIAQESQALIKTREDVSAYKHVLKELKSLEQQ